jgi:hypothetical protein
MFLPRLIYMFTGDMSYRHEHPSTCKSTSPQVPLLHLRRRRDVEVEDVDWQTHRRASIGDIHNASDVTLDRCTREEEVDLVIIVACTIPASA